MSIRVTCAGCGTTLKVKESLAGKRGKCPNCGSSIQIPETRMEGVHDAEEIGDEDFGLGDIDSEEEGELDDRKPCPACGEMILRTAAKCRYCGEVFDPALKKRMKKASAEAGEDMTTGDWVVAVLCSGIGCIAGIVWMIQGKPKGTKMFGVSLGMMVFWTVIRVLIEMAAQN